MRLALLLLKCLGTDNNALRLFDRGASETLLDGIDQPDIGVEMPEDLLDLAKGLPMLLFQGVSIVT